MTMAAELAGFEWRKNSYSGGNGDCVEIGWRKSSYSGGNGNCVEVGWPDRVAIRDSKHPTGPTLQVDVPALLAAIRAGDLT
ncbi:MAG TPA: DUF397 domain-containing protein [Pseudonocardiaceae bacterium]|nr:DUF397 domain-containing protein [Pseudonocardiaceae bacterium]